MSYDIHNNGIPGYEWTMDAGNPTGSSAKVSSIYGSTPDNCKSMYLNSWYSAVSNHTCWAGGNALGASLYAAGDNVDVSGQQNRWDQIEGWMPKFPGSNYVASNGTRGDGPWYKISSYNAGYGAALGVIHATEIYDASNGDNGKVPGGTRSNYKNQTIGSGTGLSGAGYCMRIRNTRGAGESVYTYPSTDFYLNKSEILTSTPNDGQWYLTFWAKKSTHSMSNGTVRMTCHVFGIDNDVNGTWNFSGNTGKNCASYQTRENPRSDGTRYYLQPTLTTDWVEYKMSFKFNGDPNIKHIGIRWDSKDGINANNIFQYTDLYIFRPTLHPVNVKLSNLFSSVTASENFSLKSPQYQGSIYGSLANDHAWIDYGHQNPI